MALALTFDIGLILTGFIFNCGVLSSFLCGFYSELLTLSLRMSLSLQRKLISVACIQDLVFSVTLRPWVRVGTETEG